jgi:putative ABC transport system permease protein
LDKKNLNNMLKNYLKVALRNLLRYKGFTLINIASLAVGATGCLVIALFVWDEMKFDRFFKGHENVYRVYNTSKSNTGDKTLAVTPPMFATYLKQQYPEVENVLRILMSKDQFLLEAGEKAGFENKGMFVDSSFFDFFPLKFLAGNRSTALHEPMTVVITGDLAKRYFGTTQAINNRIYIDKDTFTVKGVLAALPRHFHLDVNYLMSFPSARISQERMEKWTWQQFYTYVKLQPGTNAAQLNDKFKVAVKQETGREDAGFSFVPHLQRLENIHLQSSDFVYDNALRGNENYVKGLTIIAIFVLAIACFNFINLATARSFRRAKEIGVRKVVGADRKQLIGQFTGETILLSVISIIIATIATIIIIPYLNDFTAKAISFNPVSNPLLAIVLLAGGIIIGVVAGVYPAIVLSGFEPVKVLKGIRISSGGGHTGWLRQGLVIVQFSLSALLIVSTTIVYRQITFMHNKDLGFTREHVLFFDIQGKMGESIETFKNELKRSPNVISATSGYGLPGDQFAGDGVIVPSLDPEKRQSTSLFIVDQDYISTLGINLLAGRDFSKNRTNDVKEAFIINETAVSTFGFGTAEKALGQKIYWDKWVSDSINPIKKGVVIGVIRDFHYKSLHEKVEPAVLQIYPQVAAKIAVKVKSDDLPATIAHIHSVWNKFSPGFPLNYKFLDESFGEMYKAEDKMGTLLWVFTMMAIVVGCMGLFGLAAFSSEQRTKEIGIRKVMGASVLSIVIMLSKSFLRPVLIASVIAFPIAWTLMDRWLQDFPYRVNFSWWVFGIAAISALLIALVTVSFQTIKAAVSNPIKSLKSE